MFDHPPVVVVVGPAKRAKWTPKKQSTKKWENEIKHKRRQKKKVQVTRENGRLRKKCSIQLVFNETYFFCGALSTGVNYFSSQENRKKVKQKTSNLQGKTLTFPKMFTK